MKDRPNRGSNDLLKRQDRREEEWTDAFGKQIADGTRNVLDIASQYQFSPERLRLFNNESRQFVQYGDVTNFTDEIDAYILQPDAGDTMSLESAESAVYVVNYINDLSTALQVNQELQDGDVLKVGAYNDTDGWYLEQRGADHTPTQVDVKQLAGGTETTLETNAELERPTTDWNRYELRYNWYGVGNQIWKQTYTEDGEQFNTTVAKTSVDGERSTETGNLNVRYEITAGPSTTGLELEGGSMGALSLGTPTSLTRSKKQYERISVTGTDNTWEPIYALRIDPTNDAVNMQLSQFEALNYSANATLEAVLASFDSSNTDASGWSRPPYHHEQNSALQVTENVSQVANDSGTLKTLEAGEMFGGFTLGASVILGGANASGDSATSTTARQEKKSLLASDEAVLLARTDTAGDLDLIIDVDQNW